MRELWNLFADGFSYFGLLLLALALIAILVAGVTATLREWRKVSRCLTEITVFVGIVLAAGLVISGFGWTVNTYLPGVKETISHPLWTHPAAER